MKFRLIPVTILILGMAVVDRASNVFDIEWVQSSKASSAPTEKKEDAKEDSSHGEESDGHGEAKKEEKKPEKPKFSTVKPAENIPQFTQGEKEVLTNLSARREELEQWEADLEVKQKLLEASSQKLDEKIAELKAIKTDAEVLLQSYNEHEDAKIRSLVKIYEAMKPKDAASIFNEMDMDITLEIIDKMAEKKASPIIAAMDTKNARKITEELALRKSLKEQQSKNNVADSAEQAAAPAAAQ